MASEERNRLNPVIAQYVQGATAYWLIDQGHERASGHLSCVGLRWLRKMGMRRETLGRAPWHYLNGKLSKQYFMMETAVLYGDARTLAEVHNYWGMKITKSVITQIIVTIKEKHAVARGMERLDALRMLRILRTHNNTAYKMGRGGIAAWLNDVMCRIWSRNGTVPELFALARELTYWCPRMNYRRFKESVQKWKPQIASTPHLRPHWAQQARGALFD